MMKAKELREIVHNYGILLAVQSLGMHEERKVKYGFKRVKRSGKATGQIS